MKKCCKNGLLSHTACLLMNL